MTRAKEKGWLARGADTIQRLLHWEMSFFLGEQVWDFEPTLTPDGLIATLDNRFPRLVNRNGRAVWGHRLQGMRICLQGPNKIDIFQNGYPFIRRYLGAMYFQGRLEERAGGMFLAGRFRHAGLFRMLLLIGIHGFAAWLAIVAGITVANAVRCAANINNGCEYAVNGSMLLGFGALFSVFFLGSMRLFCWLSGWHRKKTFLMLTEIAKDAANKEDLR
jgi:hypothetical protein